MTEHQDHPAASHPLADAALEGGHDAGAGPPRDVKARDGIPRTGCGIGAPLRPAHDGEEPYAPRVQPRSLLAGREGEICLGPFPRPLVFLSIEPCCGHPVLQRQLMRIAHAKPPLLRRVDEEEAGKMTRPPARPAMVRVPARAGWRGDPRLRVRRSPLAQPGPPLLRSHQRRQPLASGLCPLSSRLWRRPITWPPLFRRFGRQSGRAYWIVTTASCSSKRFPTRPGRDTSGSPLAAASRLENRRPPP